MYGAPLWGATRILVHPILKVPGPPKSYMYYAKSITLVLGDSSVLERYTANLRKEEAVFDKLSIGMRFSE